MEQPSLFVQQSKKPIYKYCIVPECRNTIRNAPDKVFFLVPRGADIRRKWCETMKREMVSPSTCLYCCEDHFNVEEDTRNYIQYNIMKQEGENVPLRLKKGVLPHIFHHQNIDMPPPSIIRTGAVQSKSFALTEEALSESAACSSDILEIHVPPQTDYHKAGASSSHIEEMYSSEKVEEDTRNYIQYNIMKQEGENVPLRLKKGVLPHIFHHQNINMPPPFIIRTGAVQSKSFALTEEALSESTACSSDVLEIHVPPQTDYHKAGASSSHIEEIYSLDKVKMEKLAMCRICLVENVRMHEVVDTSLQELYEKLTDIPFVTEDGRPMLACFFCCAKIKQCAQFQRKCLEAEELFAQMLDEDHEPNPLLNHCQLEFFGGYIRTPVELISIDAECQEQTDIIKQELPAVCERQDYIIIEPKEEYQSDEDIHMHISESEDLLPHYSESEDIQMHISESEDLLPHHSESEDIQMHHSESADIPPHYSDEDSADELPVMEIKTEVEEDQEISTEEQRTKEMIRVPVVKIPRLDLRTIKLEEPITDKQKKNVLSDMCKNHYTCDICQCSFSSKRRLSNHIRKHTGEKPYKCEMCQLSFRLKGHLKRHTLIHTGEKPYKCEMCPLNFKEKHGLTIHIRTHTGEKPYKCGICHLRFSEKGNFNRHTRIHTGEKPYKCEMCQLSFREQYCLKIHIRTHTVKKPYKCEMCQLSFSEKGNLKRHTRIHTGEKPYKCEMCQLNFKEKHGLINHIRTHTGEKPYKCEMCQLSFSEKGNLTRHTRIHTGEKPYKCEICQRRFREKDKLIRHTRIHTGKHLNKVISS